MRRLLSDNGHPMNSEPTPDQLACADLFSSIERARCL